MKVIWTPEAEEDRAQIVAYIRADNPLAAAQMEQLFNRTASRLAEHPRLGRPGKTPGTRELIAHQSYRLVYELHDETVWVLVLVHTARQWPPVTDRKR